MFRSVYLIVPFILFGASSGLAQECGVALPGARSATAVAAGAYHTCALTDTGKVECWGNNNSGELGDGTETTSCYPVAVGGLRSVTAIAAGGFHTCALTNTGNVKCWGSNSNGQLGDGTTTDSTIPVAVGGLGSGNLAIAAGTNDTCAVTAAGAVKCWGENTNGQLGDGTTTDSSIPVAVSGLDSGIIAVAAGTTHTCAVSAAGVVKCWGNNSYGQLGDGTRTSRLAPGPRVRGIKSGAIVIALGQLHTCAVTATGRVMCWGNNSDGAIGDGTSTERDSAVFADGLGTSVAALDAGDYHNCAVIGGDHAKCWGFNSDGQIGDGTTTKQPTPVAVKHLSGAIAIAAGRYHSCAVTTAGGLKCWGDNEIGQLGDGTTTDELTPVNVRHF